MVFPVNGVDVRVGEADYLALHSPVARIPPGRCVVPN